MAPKKQLQGSTQSTAASSTQSASSSSCQSTSSSSCQSTSTPPPVSSSTSPPVSSSTLPPVSPSPSPSPPVSSSTSASASTVASTSVSTSTFASASATSSPTTSSSISASVALTDEIPIKLDGKNYLAWSEEVEGVLKAHNLLGFVVKPVIPEQYASESDRTQNIETEEYRRWFVQDQMLHTWLLSSLCKGVAPLMARCKYSWQVWDTVKEHFHSHLKAKVRQLRSELRNTRKENRSVSEYVDKIQSIVDSLAETGSPVSAKDHVEAVLGGLPREYRSVIKMTRTLQSLTVVTVSDIETWLLILEEKFRSEYRHVDGGGGPSTPDNAPSCSPQCSTAEGGRGSRRRRGHGRGGRRRGRN